jgi:hypothetical protein
MDKPIDVMNHRRLNLKYKSIAFSIWRRLWKKERYSSRVGKFWHILLSFSIIRVDPWEPPDGRVSWNQ